MTAALKILFEIWNFNKNANKNLPRIYCCFVKTENLLVVKSCLQILS